MPKVKLDIETDLTPVTNALTQGEKIIQESGVTVTKFGDDAKKAYMKAWQEAHKFNDEVKQGGKAVKEVGDRAKAVDAGTAKLRELRMEIKRLTGEAIALKQKGDLVGADATIKKVGELKDELKDIQDAIKAVSGNARENMAKGFGTATKIAAQGFEGILAVQGLVGEENENFQKQLLKLQAIQSLARIAGEFGDIGDRIREIKLGLAPVTNLYARGNDALKAFFKKGKEGAIDLAAGNKSLFASLADGAKNLATSGINSFKAFWATIRANPLGILLVALGGLITTLVAIKDRVKPIGDAFEFLGNVVELMISPFKKLAELVGLIADENERRSVSIIKNTQKEIDLIKEFYDTEIKLAEISRKKTDKLETEKFNKTRDRIEATIIELDKLERANGKLNEEQRKQLEETLDIERKLTNERIELLRKQQQDKIDAMKESEKKITELQVAAIKDDETREVASVHMKANFEIEALEEKAKLLFDANEVEAAVGEERKAIIQAAEKEIADIRKKFADKRKEDNDKILALEKDFQDAFLDIIKRIEANKTALLTGEERIEAETEVARKELEVLRKNLIAKGQAEEDFAAKVQHRKAERFKLTADQQEQFDILEAQLFDQQTQKLIALEVERQNALARAKTAAAKQTESTLGTQESADILTVQGTARPEGLSEANFEEQKQIAILQIQKQYAEKRLQLKKDSLSAEREELVKGYNGELEIVGDGEDAESQRKRADIIKRLGLTEAEFAARQAETQAAYDAELAGIDAQLKKLQTKNPFDLARLLGISQSDLNNIETAINQVKDTFDTILNDVIAEHDEQIRISQEKQNQYEKDIESLESKIEKEQELGDTGKANNKTRLLEEIENTKQLQQKQLEIEKKALEEKKKAQKEKLLLDSIAQASNIITASSEILAATAGGGPVGVAIGVVTIAAMIAAFVAAKASALKAIDAQKPSDAQNLSKGEIDIKGPGSETSDSIPANLSRGESVMTAKETKENKSLFKGIRYKNKELIQKGILKLLEDTGVTLPRELPQALANKKEAIKEAELKVYVSNNYSDLKNEQAQTNKRLDELIAASKRKSYLNQNGDFVQEFGSHKIITRKNG